MLQPLANHLILHLRKKRKGCLFLHPACICFGGKRKLCGVVVLWDIVTAQLELGDLNLPITEYGIGGVDMRDPVWKY